MALKVKAANLPEVRHVVVAQEQPVVAVSETTVAGPAPGRVRVRMLETKQGSPDGITAQEFTKDHEYDIGPDLARSFCDRKIPVADRVSDANR